MSTRKPISAALIAASAFLSTPSYADAVFSTVFGNVTITFTYKDADSFQLKLENVQDANGSWAGIQYLGAWSFNDILASIGANPVATATYLPPSTDYPGSFQTALDASGCSTNGNPNKALCFDFGTPGLILPANPNDTMIFNVELTNATIKDLASASLSPDFKIQWLEDNSCNENQRNCEPYKKVGSLYSQGIPTGSSSGSGGGSTGSGGGSSGTVPEPNSNALALLGVVALASVMWKRRRAVV